MTPKLAGAFLGGILVALGGAYLFFARGGGLASDNFRFAAELPLAALSERAPEIAPPRGTPAQTKQSVKKSSSSKGKTSSPSPFGLRLTQQPSPPVRPSPVFPAQTRVTPSATQIPLSLPDSPVQTCGFATNAAPVRTSVIINEVAWMGSGANANDEWIELKNISAAAVDLMGFRLLDQSEQIRVVFDAGDAIPAGGFALLERSSDAAAPNAPADKIFAGALGNVSEGLRLFNNQCESLDEVIAHPDWPAGDNDTKRTMERDTAGFGWHTSSVIGGTPRAANSALYVPPTPSPSPTPTATRSPTSGPASIPTPSPTPTPSSTPSPTPTPTATPTPTPTPTPSPSPTPTPTPTPTPQPSPASNANHVLIGEVQVAGADAGDEFIELYNPTDAAVDLSGWSVQYVSGNATSTEAAAKKNFVGGNVIPARGFFLVARAKNVSGVDGYTGVVAADLAHRSFSMSGAAVGAKAFLVNDQERVESFADPNIVDALDYSFAVPSSGQSVERKAWQGNCVLAQGTGESLGNGCDTDNPSDFESRAVPSPQNTQSGLEP